MASEANKDKLLYFDVFGRGEAIRMIYALAGQALEDVRVSYEEWPSIKGDQPLGTLPVFTTADGVLIQSTSIVRYAAKKFGMVGEGLWEETLHDMILESCIDIIKDVPLKLYQWMLFSAPKPDDSEKMVSDIREKMIKQFSYIQSIAEERGKRYIVGDKIGMAEIWVYTSLEFISTAFPDYKELTPWIKEFVTNFESDERVKDYLSTRKPSSTGY